jgi:hypothetical protein
MNSLIQQLNEQAHARQELFRNQHDEWMMKFEPLYTHFVTLTFHPQRINSLKNNLERDSLLKLQKKSFRCFLNRLRKNLYGCSWSKHEQNILCIPVLEGLFNDGKVHYHCLFGIEQSRHETFARCVKDAWSKSPLSGQQIDVTAYRNSGAIGYMTKQTKYINRESVDWDNVLISSHANLLIAE